MKLIPFSSSFIARAPPMRANPSHDNKKAQELPLGLLGVGGMGLTDQRG
jgi:hypothetical protein